MKTPKTSQSRKPLRLTTETLKTLETRQLDNVVGGAAAGSEFPCFTVNNCPSPA